MSGLNEVITITKYWQRWSDPRLIVLVLNNRHLNQVTWEQRALEGDPRYDASQERPGLPLRLLRRVPRAERHLTDPEVPPLSPHITLEEAKSMMTALVGEEDRARILTQTLKGKL